MNIAVRLAARYVIRASAAPRARSRGASMARTGGQRGASGREEDQIGDPGPLPAPVRADRGSAKPPEVPATWACCLPDRRAFTCID